MALLEGLQSGTPDLSGAAGQAMPDQQAVQQRVQQIVQQLIQSRTGGQSPLVYGPEIPHPNMPLPPAQPERVGIPQGPFGSTGERKRADKQAIFSSVANIVQTAQKKHYDLKVQKLTHDFETLVGAVKGYNEAQSSGNQEAMKHNANIINQITSDPKKAKELAKAFDVNLNPMAQEKKKEKPNPANDALKKAFAADMQKYQSGQTMLAPQAQAMMRGIPQTAQVDPRLAIMEQLTKSGVLPKAGEELAFQSDLMKITNNAMQHGLDRNNKKQLAEMLGEASDRRSSMMVYRTILQVAGAKERAEILADAWKYRADKSLKGVEDRNKVISERNRSLGQKSDRTITEATNAVKSQVATLKTAMDAAVKTHDKARIKDIQTKIDALQNMQKLIGDVAMQRIGVDPDATQSIPTGLSQDDYSSFLELFKDAEPEPGDPDTK